MQGGGDATVIFGNVSRQEAMLFGKAKGGKKAGIQVRSLFAAMPVSCHAAAANATGEPCLFHTAAHVVGATNLEVDRGD